MKLKDIIFEEIIKQINETTYEQFQGYTFADDTHGAYGGQVDMHVDMYKNNQKLAYADYTIFEDKVYINYVESLVKGKGYGTILMEYLADKYGYENLERQSLTSSGAKMRQRLDKKFDFDYKKHKENQNKHIDPDSIAKINNHVIREFLFDLSKMGYEKAWEKWLQNPEFVKTIKNPNEFDLNDVAEIAEWIKGSVLNDNHPDDAPPEWVMQTLDSLT
ncbi:MAG: hypothetical protein ACOCVF_01425 [bacterium]